MRTTFTTLRASRRATSSLLSLLLGLGLAVSGLPSPLYSSYQRVWGFSPLTLTAIFAIYAATALVSVLLAGRLSDSIGRKPALLAAQVLLLAGLVLFMLAESVWWIVLARSLHGLAIGTIVVTAGAALVDLTPEHASRIGRLIAMSSGTGMAVGTATTSVLAHLSRSLTIAPYAVATAITLITLLGTACTRETNQLLGRRGPWMQSPRVPPDTRDVFRFAALGVCAAWAVLGVYLSLVPKLVEVLVGDDTPLAGGAAVTVMLGSAVVAQAWTYGADMRRTAIMGNLVLCLGLTMSVTLPGAMVAYLAAPVVGTGYGLGFSGSLRSLASVIPADKRGEMMSAYYLVAYGSLAIPALLAGLAGNRFGVMVSYGVFASAAALICVVAAWFGWTTTRPER